MYTINCRTSEEREVVEKIVLGFGGKVPTLSNTNILNYPCPCIENGDIVNYFSYVTYSGTPLDFCEFCANPKKFLKPSNIFTAKEFPRNRMGKIAAWTLSYHGSIVMKDGNGNIIILRKEGNFADLGLGWKSFDVEQHSVYSNGECMIELLPEGSKVEVVL